MLSRCNFLVALSILLSFFTGLDAQYHWACSALDADSNRHYLPQLEDDIFRLFNQGLLGPSNPETVFIFPITSELNCNGTVSEIGYCYNLIETGDDHHVFTLLILTQKEFNFRIVDTIEVYATDTSECRQSFCCAFTTLDGNKFFLPENGFAFGIVSSSLFAIRSSVSQYRVEHYQLPITELPIEPSVIFTLEGEERTLRSDRSLRAVQFNIAPLVNIELATTNQPTEISTTNSLMESTTALGGSNNSSATNTTSQESAGIAFIAAGGVGAFVAMAILALVIITAGIVAVFRSRRQKRKQLSCPHPADIADDPYSPSPHMLAQQEKPTYCNTANHSPITPSPLLTSRPDEGGEIYRNIPATHEAKVYDQPRHHSIETGQPLLDTSGDRDNQSETSKEAENVCPSYDYIQGISASASINTTANEAYGVSLSYQNESPSRNGKAPHYVNTTDFM